MPQKAVRPRPAPRVAKLRDTVSSVAQPHPLKNLKQFAHPRKAS